MILFLNYSMSSNQKIYLIAEDADGKVRFRNHRWDIVWYWAWGNEDQPKFIITALVNRYWLEEGVMIYEKYNQALLDIASLWDFKKPTACITLYQSNY